MNRTEHKINRRKLRSSYFTSTISVALVLLIVGLVGLLVLNARLLSRHVKENIGFSVILHDGIKEVDMIRLKKNLDASSYTKSTRYITKEEAAEELKVDLGEDFVEFLGYNPLLPSIDLKLFADYANQDSIKIIEEALLEKEEVKEVAYQKSLVNKINENVKKISLILLVFSGVLFIIALSLINNTIRMLVYSRRFIIRTMQLVGATHSFVRAPFLINSIARAIYSVLISYVLLGGIVYAIDVQLPELNILGNVNLLAILFGGLLVIGILIVLVSTWFAVNKYLRLKTSDLYF
jgi:cell division transport system permease protein